MKGPFLFLLLGIGMLSESLWGQNPIIRHSYAEYDFGTGNYQLQYETSYEYDEKIWLKAVKDSRWRPGEVAAWRFSQSSFTYFPDSTVATRVYTRFNSDTLMSYYFSAFNEKGDIIRDSSWYLNEDHEAEINSSRYHYTYSNQGQKLEMQSEIKDGEALYWRNQTYQNFQYDPSGCLIEKVTGLSPDELNYRERYTYENGCRLKSYTTQVRNGYGFWIMSRRAQYTYESFSDSSLTLTHQERYLPESEEWETEYRIRQLDNLNGQPIHIFGTYEDRESFQEINRYDAQGKRTYTRSGTQVSPAAQWIWYFEYRFAEITPQIRSEYWAYNWDTLRQAYNQSFDQEMHWDPQNRLDYVLRTDSTWDGNAYQTHQQRENYQYEEFCDGETKTRFIGLSLDGLPAQPYSKTTYGYLNSADCTPESDFFDMKISPNPAGLFINLESEALLQENTQIRLLDLQGKEIRRYQNTSRQERFSVYLEELPPGIYILQLIHQDQSISKLFCKQ